MPLNLSPTLALRPALTAINKWASWIEGQIHSTQGTVATALQGSQANYIATNTTPAAPSGLGATSLKASAALSWNANIESDISAFKVYRSTTNSFPTASCVNAVHATAYAPAAYYDPVLTSDTPYYYWVTAVDQAGAESLPSFSTTVTPS